MAVSGLGGGGGGGVFRPPGRCGSRAHRQPRKWMRLEWLHGETKNAAARPLPRQFRANVLPTFSFPSYTAFTPPFPTYTDHLHSYLSTNPRTHIGIGPNTQHHVQPASSKHELSNSKLHVSVATRWMQRSVLGNNCLVVPRQGHLRRLCIHDVGRARPGCRFVTMAALAAGGTGGGEEGGGGGGVEANGLVGGGGEGGGLKGMDEQEGPAASGVVAVRKEVRRRGLGRPGRMGRRWRNGRTGGDEGGAARAKAAAAAWAAAA